MFWVVKKNHLYDEQYFCSMKLHVHSNISMQHATVYVLIKSTTLLYLFDLTKVNMINNEQKIDMIF